MCVWCIRGRVRTCTCCTRTCTFARARLPARRARGPNYSVIQAQPRMPARRLRNPAIMRLSASARALARARDRAYAPAYLACRWKHSPLPASPCRDRETGVEVGHAVFRSPASRHRRLARGFLPDARPIAVGSAIRAHDNVRPRRGDSYVAIPNTREEAPREGRPAILIPR